MSKADKIIFGILIITICLGMFWLGIEQEKYNMIISHSKIDCMDCHKEGWNK